MRNITFLSPWAVRYSEANGCFIVYVPSGSIVGGKCDVSSLTSALSPNANSGAGDTAKQTAKLTNWFQIDAASFSYSGDIIAAFVRKEENEEQGGETSEEGDAEETPDDTTDDEEEDSPSTDNEELALSDAYVVSFHTDTSSIPENAISVILASVSYDAQSESTSITQYVVGAITLPEKREEKDQLAVAWLVRRKPEEKSTTDDTDSDKNDGKADETESETPKKTAWQVYSPIWTWGKGVELLVTGMQEGWNDIPVEVASGTLYAVMELRGTKDGYGNIAWNPKEMTLKNTLDGLVNRIPTGEGSSAEPGVRWLAVRIGSFPEVDTSLSPEDDRRPFNQLHIGMIVERFAEVTTDASAEQRTSYALGPLVFEDNQIRQYCGRWQNTQDGSWIFVKAASDMGAMQPAVSYPVLLSELLIRQSISGGSSSSANYGIATCSVPLLFAQGDASVWLRHQEVEVATALAFTPPSSEVEMGKISSQPVSLSFWSDVVPVKSASVTLLETITEEANERTTYEN